VHILKRPIAVTVSILISPFATVLAWANLLRRRDLTPALKGLWIVLCLMPILGPLLYLGIGRGRFELVFDKISGFFISAALFVLLVVGANRMLGNLSQTLQITIPTGPVISIPQPTGLLMLLLLIAGGLAALEWLLGPALRRGFAHVPGD